MDRYIGLDVHAQSCTMAVLGPSGRRLKVQIIETNGRALVDAIKSVAGQRRVCLEEGTQSAWLHELLSPHVAELVVTVPRERKGAKDDLRDATELAEQLRIGSLATRVYKAPKQMAGLKNAVRAYTMATRDVVRVKNRLKAVFRSRGVETTRSIYDPSSRSAWIQKLPPAHRRMACWMREEAKAHPIVRILATAPGLGPTRSAQLVAIVGTPHRFRTSRQFWSYCGLGIVTRSSSDWVPDNGRWIRAKVNQTRGLSRQRHPLLKAVFKGAATTVIQQMSEHPLHQNYQRMLAGGTKPNLAKLTLARRIAAAVLAMWKHEEVYNPERIARTSKP